MSKSRKNRSSKRKPASQPNNPKRWALLAILFGLLAGVAFIYFFVFQDESAAPADVASQSENTASGQGNANAAEMLLASDGIPIASAKGIDNKGAQPTVGQPAPNFALQLPDGATVTRSDFEGRPMIINFWATWCPPCRREMPDLVKAYETHKGEGLIVLEVNSAEAPAQVEGFVEEFNVTAPVAIDARNEVMAVYRTNGLPATFFIDKDGVIQAHWPGFLDAKTLDELLEKIL